MKPNRVKVFLCRNSSFIHYGILVLVFLIGLILPANLWSLAVPEHPSGRIHDAAGLLKPEESSELEEKLAQFEARTTNQIVVAIFPSLEEESLEDFSIRLAQVWKIGQKGKDNGVILLIFPQDRKLRIEVGYGLEAQIPDALASRIIQKIIIPAFRHQNFASGIRDAVDAMISAIEGKIPTGLSDEENSHRLTEGESKLISIILFAVILFLFSLSLIVRWVNYRNVTYGRHPSRTWDMFFGYGGGGGRGGFSGGGGSIGGGGSSGSW